MPSSRVRPRAVTYHFTVQHLQVPEAWHVGRVVFRPRGWLAKRIDAGLTRAHVPARVVEVFKQEMDALTWATADIAVTASDTDHKSGSAESIAREAVRDAIAVLRLYQRRRYRRVSVEHQTFGLGPDVAAVRETSWATSRGRMPRLTGRWHGVLGDWSFREVDLAAYPVDPRFAYLDTALCVPDESRTDWQQRAVSAARTMDRATANVAEGLRVVLAAMALEVLLGEHPASDSPGGTKNIGSHLVIRRAAYLTCRDASGVPHGQGRPACFFLTLKSAAKVTQWMSDLYDRDEPNACSYYLDVAAVFDSRNAFLHHGWDGFRPGAGELTQGHVDEVMLHALDWVIARGASTLNQLDQEIDALPRM
jgi:hypothetical protein